MNFGRTIFGRSVGVVLIACGGATSTGRGSESGSGGNSGSNGSSATSGAGSSTGGNAGSCSISAGTYTQHFTLAAGDSSTCPNIPDQMQTINGNEILTGGSSATPDAGGAGCTDNVNASTCSTTLNCNTTVSGFTTQISASLTFSGNSATGTETITDTDPDAGFSLSCTYDVTMTKN
jgi:hypothetical protein